MALGGGNHASGGAVALADGGTGMDEEVNIQSVEGGLRANALRKLTALVERHPEESLSIVRTWLRQEEL